MPSQVQICNLALLKFGDIAITTINDATAEARACKILWDMMVDEMLYSHPWNFALKRIDLGAYLVDTPAFEFDYKYTLPGDYLRVWELYGSDADWVIENGEFLTNDETAEIRYISRVTDISKFNPAFANCLAIRLAAELAPKLAQDKSMKAALLEELRKIWIPQAYVLNAIEGNPRRHKDEQELSKGNYSWQKEGR